MKFTKNQRLEITGRAIANRLKHRDFTGERLDRAIEEVCDDMHDADTIAGETIRDVWENDISGRDWNAIRRQAKQTLQSIRGV